MACARISVALLFAFRLAMPAAQAGEDRAGTQIEIPAHEPVLLKFRAFDPSRVLIDEQAMLKEVFKGLEGLSNHPLKTQGSLVRHQSGLRIKLDVPQSRIHFEYVNLDLYDSGSQYGQSLTISALYEVARGERDFEIHLRVPRTAELLTRNSRGIFRVPTPKLDSPEGMLQDFAAILEAAPRLIVNRQCDVKGEKTSTYKPEAVMGNFDRLLGRHGSASGATQTGGLDRPDVFAYLAGQIRVPLTIAAVPYREGAKIIYSAALPYTLRADGTGEQYELPEKLSTDIDRILAD